MSVAVLAEKKGAGVVWCGKIAKKSADGGAEVASGKVAFGMDAVGKGERFAEIGRIAAESAVTALGGHGGVVRQGFEERRIFFRQMKQDEFVGARPGVDIRVALAFDGQAAGPLEGHVFVKGVRLLAVEILDRASVGGRACRRGTCGLEPNSAFFGDLPVSGA